MTPSRKAEDNIEVFELGHYEQMQLALALDCAIEEFEAIDPEDRTPRMREGNAHTLEELRVLFAAYGTTTIIRKNRKSWR